MSDHVLNDGFTEKVLARTDRAERLRIARKVALVFGCALAGVFLQDFALEVTAILLLNLVPISDGLIAALLAPVNTVGALLSAVLLCLRIIYKRLF